MLITKTCCVRLPEYIVMCVYFFSLVGAVHHAAITDDSAPRAPWLFRNDAVDHAVVEQVPVAWGTQ